MLKIDRRFCDCAITNSNGNNILGWNYGDPTYNALETMIVYPIIE